MSNPKFSNLTFTPEMRVILSALLLIVALFLAILFFTEGEFEVFRKIMPPFLAAAAVVFFTAAGIAYARLSVSQQATLKVMDEFSSERLREGRDLIRRLHINRDKTVGTIINNTDAAENFRFFAEYMENLAIGLQHQIYNYQMIKDWLGKDARFYYRAAEPMIERYRKYTPSDGPKGQYRNFEALADHFSKPDNPMSDKNRLLIAIIVTGLVIGGWLSMSIGEIRADIRDIRAEMRENRAIAEADSDKNSAAHLSDHAAPETPKAE